MKYHFPDYYEMEDMYGIGVKALITAVNQFNPSKGKSFGNYAALRIKGSLLDELRKIDSLPRANRAKAKSLQATISELESKFKRSVTVDEVRKELDLSQSEYEVLLHETQPITFVPFDGPIHSSSSEEDSTSLSETIADPTDQNALEQTEHREKVVLLRMKSKNSDPQKKILMLYYYEELKLSEIAHVFWVVRRTN